MKYNTALPYFSNEDIDIIIPQLEEILKGNGFFTKGPKVKEFEKLFSECKKYNKAIIGSNVSIINKDKKQKKDLLKLVKNNK